VPRGHYTYDGMVQIFFRMLPSRFIVYAHCFIVCTFFFLAQFLVVIAASMIPDNTKSCNFKLFFVMLLKPQRAPFCAPLECRHDSTVTPSYGSYTTYSFFPTSPGRRLEDKCHSQRYHFSRVWTFGPESASSQRRSQAIQNQRRSISKIDFR